MKKYDVCIIGAGPAGYAAAMRAVDFDKKVILIEKQRLGGAGIHNGALWSKTWWELAREASIMRRNNERMGVGRLTFSFQELKKEVSEAVKERTHLLKHHLQNINHGLDKELLDYVQGTATILTPNKVQIERPGEEENMEVHTDFIVCATGSRPRILPNIPIDETHIFTSDGLDKLDAFPSSMVILGAGVIGCEFATIFSNFGQTQVHLIDKGDRILPFEDEDVVRVIEKNLEQNGVVIHRNSQLIDMRTDEDGVVYTLEYTDGRKEIFHVEKALVSVGRVPNYEELFDESLKIELDTRGIKDHMTQTNIPNIFAVGDITADISLVNVGELEGRFAIEKMFGKPAQSLIYDNISTIMFLKPEVAGVGMNEIQARKKGISYKMVSIDYRCIPRAMAMRNTQGFIKILVTNDEDMKILGMRVVGEHASSAIQAVALLILMDRSILELAGLIHPHPSIIEGIQECARMLVGSAILKPAVLREAMSCKVWEGDTMEDLIINVNA